MSSSKKRKLAEYLGVDAETKTFKKFIKQENKKATRSSSSFILVESFQSPSNQVGLSIFLPQLSQYSNSRILGYYFKPKNILAQVKRKGRLLFSVESAMGFEGQIAIPRCRSRDRDSLHFLKEMCSPEDLENFEVEGVVIGDLIYDTYLRDTDSATVEFNDPDFRRVFAECMQIFWSLWDLYLDLDITAVCVSHCVYHYAISARIAVHLDIPAFQVTGEHVYRMSKQNSHAYTEFKFFKNDFQALSLEEQREGIELAKARLELRFQGQIGVDMPYSTQSAFEVVGEHSWPGFAQDGKPRILIATHDFFDSPHSYGNNFYPDFFIWLDSLGRISEVTDYHWYLKTHKDSVAEDTHIFSTLLQRYPKFQVLDSRISHHEIIAEGIDFALTVFGTIAMEYPYFGVPVINASKLNPHVSFNFSITPRDKNEYEEILLNLPCKKDVETRNEIYEYYYMAHLKNPKSWIYKSYEEYLEKVGGHAKSTSTSSFLEYMRGGQNKRNRVDLESAVIRFLESGDFHLDSRHILDNGSDGKSIF